MPWSSVARPSSTAAMHCPVGRLTIERTVLPFGLALGRSSCAGAGPLAGAVDATRVTGPIPHPPHNVRMIEGYGRRSCGRCGGVRDGSAQA